MPQATFQKTAANVGRTCRFGGRALPNGQGTLSYVNLNDWTSWFLQSVDIEIAQTLTLGAQLWQGQSVNLGADFPPAVVRLSMEYREAVASLGTALGALAVAGDQYLSFDTVTALPVRFSAASNRQAVMYAPALPRWSLDLEFSATQQFWQDLTPTAIGATTLNSGTATPFNVTYAGSVFARPVWTLTIPNTSTATIAGFTLSNVTAGQTLSLVFPGNLAASTSWVLTIDSGAFAVRDAGGRPYDVGGSFPNLYGPAGQVNAMSATLTTASGTATNCTISGSVTPRWLL
jgi:hypothetical protein